MLSQRSAATFNTKGQIACSRSIYRQTAVKRIGNLKIKRKIIWKMHITIIWHVPKKTVNSQSYKVKCFQKGLLNIIHFRQCLHVQKKRMNDRMFLLDLQADEGSENWPTHVWKSDRVVGSGQNKNAITRCVIWKVCVCWLPHILTSQLLVSSSSPQIHNIHKGWRGAQFLRIPVQVS